MLYTSYGVNQWYVLKSVLVWRALESPFKIHWFDNTTKYVWYFKLTTCCETQPSAVYLNFTFTFSNGHVLFDDLKTLLYLDSAMEIHWFQDI